MPTKQDITLLLRQIDDGEAGAMDQLMNVVYDDLERMAASQLHRQFGERAGQITLEPAALVNESFLQLLRQRKGFDNRGQFFAIATRLMLRVLKDYRRQKRAAMRGGAGDEVRMTLAIDRVPGGAILKKDLPQEIVEIDALAAALDRLEGQDPRSAEILKMRTVWGMTVADIAETLEVSPKTIERDWKWAKAWLAEELGLIHE